MIMNTIKKTKGFIALTSVLVLSTLFLSITISMASRTISESQIQRALAERDTAQYLAEACIEEGLSELVHTFDYNGNTTTVVGEGECEILEVSGIGTSHRVLRTESVVGQHTYRTEVILESISPHVRITSHNRITKYEI